MTAPERLARLLPALEDELISSAGTLREVRLRAGRPAQLLDGGGRRFVGEPVRHETLARTLVALMDFSVHTREEELSRGFFTLMDGSRVGVCGAASAGRGAVLGLDSAGSACIRIARAVPGCADPLMPLILTPGGPRSALLVSPPGMGKTTCLRDIARQLSLAGQSVCVADERHEIAACHRGVPGLDVGPSTDVMDGGGKAAVIPMLLRAMSPGVIVADEIGGPGDAAALAEARRCGAAVIASAHGADLDALALRRDLRDALEGGVFDCMVLLGDAPGRVKAVREFGKGEARLCGCA